ncbi:MAG: biopolymer transporter ExbD [Holophaga sp.]|nr:biopolymer transporter ExbD [Holophaga sp.]
MSGGHAKSDINVTPLIDIVLVLLIIFIVMVPGMSKSMPVVVPQVVKKDVIDPPSKDNVPLVVEVDPTPDNKAYIFKFQSEAMELSELANRITPVTQLQPAGMRKVFVKIDEETPYQVAVQVLDQIRVASNRAKKETAAKPEWGGQDGGDIRIATSLKKRNP